MSAPTKREFRPTAGRTSIDQGISKAERMRDRPDAFQATDIFYRGARKPTRAENDHLARTDRSELVRRNIPLVLYTVSNLLRMRPKENLKRFNPGGPKIGFGRNDRVKADDFIQDGILGLIRASETFDPDLGFSFPTYALPWIIQTISHGDSRQDTVHLPVAVARAIRVEPETLAPAQRESAYRVIGGFSDIDQSAGSGGDETEAAWMGPRTIGETIAEPPRDLEDEMFAVDALRLLSPLERKVIECRFGIVGPPLDLMVTARECGITRREARETERRALRKMEAVAHT